MASGHPHPARPAEIQTKLRITLKARTYFKDGDLPTLLLRTTLLNLKQQNTLINIPLYAIGVLPRLVERTGLLL